MDKYLKYKSKYLQLKKKYNFINENNLFYDLNIKYQKEGFQNIQKNILGTELVPCSLPPGKTTGFYRDGTCKTGPDDVGTHIVCAIVDDNFLEFTKSKGNNLISPRLPSFPGLVAGDKWCLCILRWIEAYKAGKAPKIVPESTNELALKYIGKDILMKFAVNQ
jgi:uncharacterized protein (DUF2237 family)